MDNYSARNDQELIAHCCNGDEQAWAELITRYKRLIYAIPFKYRLSADEAADVFQTVCAILLENLHAVKDHSKLSAWLVTTTSRECWKVLREKKRAGPPIDSGPDGEPAAEPVDPTALPEQVLREIEEQHMV